jgi:hypothetical protein
VIDEWDFQIEDDPGRDAWEIRTAIEAYLKRYEPEGHLALTLGLAHNALLGEANENINRH